jgi:hypothetical protein
MIVGRIAVISVLTLVSVFAATSDDKQALPPAAVTPQKLPSPQETTAELAKAPPISKQTRMDLIHAFNAELVYVRTPFPMGKTGITLKDGVTSPSGDQLRMLMATYGPATKAGDMAQITDIQIKDRVIHFEINGGPVKRKKWYQRVTVSGGGGEVPVAPSDNRANPRGSFVDLVFDRPVPELTPTQLKALLWPVFDFNSKSPLEAYLQTVPPKVQEAIKAHHVLVGMNHEMVIFAKGRPPKKLREKDGETDYEEWIYGEPPQDVDFVRFVGDEVVRVENMKVGGEKVVRTEKEVDIKPAESVASAGAAEQPRPANAPTLRRPGEPMPDTTTPKSIPSGNTPPMGPTQGPTNPGGGPGSPGPGGPGSPGGNGPQ